MLSGEYESSTRSSLSYLEACLLGRTKLMDIGDNTNDRQDSKQCNIKIKPAANQMGISTAFTLVGDRHIGWFTHGLETRMHPQVHTILILYS